MIVVHVWLATEHAGQCAGVDCPYIRGLSEES